MTHVEVELGPEMAKFLNAIKESSRATYKPGLLHFQERARIENSEADDTNSGPRLRDAYLLVPYIAVAMVFLYAYNP